MFTRVLISVILLYQRYLSPFKGSTCRFYPSCSLYTLQALQTYGFRRGSLLALVRLGKCHPWHAGGYDPLP
jgi:putative membrane protein insertion efficiency factor